MLIMRRKGITWSGKNKGPEKKKLHILGNIGSRHHQTTRDGKKIEEYLRRMRKQPETKLYYRHIIKEINKRVISLVRYSGPYLKFTREELQQIDQRTRKLVEMHKSIHPRDDRERLGVKKRRRKRTHQCRRHRRYIDATTQRLHKKEKKY